MSTFGDTGSLPQAKRPAPVDDCATLGRTFHSQDFDGKWLFVRPDIAGTDVNKFTTITSFKNCAIAIWAAGEGKAEDCQNCVVAMGNKDASDVITTSINKHSATHPGATYSNSKMFATGNVHCNAKRWGNNGGERSVDWLIFNPNP
ncbi:hypothetical protein PG993_014082 [Apiospora rasikravindrae]|uniref:Ecp2 effector protein-like domain-containing protein n=1 Tax=Apiospora rasikravindrae TaxID=990691 RepID=A0ABR1RS08_9PEZI